MQEEKTGEEEEKGQIGVRGRPATYSSGNSVAYWIFWVREKLSQPALEQMAFMPASLEKL